MTDTSVYTLAGAPVVPTTPIHTHTCAMHVWYININSVCVCVCAAATQTEF